jgi:hypothetical protein
MADMGNDLNVQELFAFQSGKEQRAWRTQRTCLGAQKKRTPIGRRSDSMPIGDKIGKQISQETAEQKESRFSSPKIQNYLSEKGFRYGQYVLMEMYFFYRNSNEQRGSQTKCHAC